MKATTFFLSRFLRLSLITLVSVSHLASAETVVRTPHVDASLVSEVKSVQAGQPFWVALKLTLEDGWHTYWINPGDSGAPTELEWELPKGFSAGPILWPTPERQEIRPLVNYGYAHQVLHLVQLTPPETWAPSQEADGDFTLRAKARWLVCKESCIPGRAEVSLTLPIDRRAAGAMPEYSLIQRELFDKTRARLPMNGPKGVVRDATPQDLPPTLAPLTRDASGYFVLTLKAPASIKGFTYFFPERWEFTKDTLPPAGSLPPINPAGDQLRLSTETNEVSVLLPKTAGFSSPLVTLRGVWVDEKGDAYSIEAESDTAAATSSPLLSLLLGLKMAAFAFIGGILLNLMPCVFPVLSLKALELAQTAGSKTARVRAHSLAFAGGVTGSFLVLGALLLLLRATGQSLGWGFQLQSPVFVSILALIFWGIALNLWGVYELAVSLSSKGTRWLSRKSQALSASNAQSDDTLLGSAASGVLATVAATPCTAPFMGAALGYAITQPSFITLVVFTFLGLGMSLPYGLLALSPTLLSRLPKPGRWMIQFKKILSLPVVGTSLWLLWVLWMQRGFAPVTLIVGVSLLGAVAAWRFGKWQRQEAKTVLLPLLTFAMSTTLVLVLIGLGIVGTTVSATSLYSPSSSPSMVPSPLWLKYDPEAVKDRLKLNQPVFVDFTAAWCVSCQVNERVVLNREDVQAAFRQKQVALFKADWTSYDADITRALASFGRSGVPLYLLYSGEQNAAPLILPEILTPSMVLDAINSLP